MTTSSPQQLPAWDRGLLDGLRTEVLRFKARSPRGLVPATVSVGRPGGPSVGPVSAVGSPETLDAHLRMETALVLCDQARTHAPVGTPVLWLTRSGPLESGQLDAVWWATTMSVWEEQGLEPAFAVVTRQGWRLEPGDLRREWRRVR